MPAMARKKDIQLLESYKNRLGINYDLARFKDLLNKLKNPHKKVKKVAHVAGTNGKGSTIAFMEAALIENGIQVGVYTSPHLFSYNERFRVNGSPISDADFSDILKPVLKHSNELCTEFELLTAMAFLYFDYKKVDVILLETGMGGLLDCTNVIIPDVSIITRIGLDHQEILGDTITQITAEKIGIIKDGVPVVTTTMQPEDAKRIISLTCTAMELSLYETKPAMLPDNFTLQGRFQEENLAIAKQALDVLYPGRLSHKKSADGYKKAFHPGRFERIKTELGTLILDAAHNPSAMVELIESLKKYYPDKKPSVYLGILNRKDYEGMIDHLLNYVDTLYLCDFSPEQSVSMADIEGIERYRGLILPVSLSDLGAECRKHELSLITGSIYFLSNVYPLIKK
jgi:dihydrofolate synthase / folylpolyglutamate synthase